MYSDKNKEKIFSHSVITLKRKYYTPSISQLATWIDLYE